MNSTIYIYNSRPDFAGNCYYAFTYSENGKSVSGKISGGESNIRAAIYDLFNGDCTKTFHMYEKDMKIRDFNKMVRDWKYAGCEPAKIAAWIKNNIK